MSLGKFFYWPLGQRPNFYPPKIWENYDFFQIWSYYISLDLFFYADYEKQRKWLNRVVSEVTSSIMNISLLHLHFVILYFVITFVIFFKIIINTYIPFVSAGVISTTTKFCARYSSLVTTASQCFAL